MNHLWNQRLLATLPDEALAAPVDPDDPLWERIETGMVRLGSLAHSQVDLDRVADDCLTLLETRTKDMRVLVQLLRCLQHPAKAAPFASALLLLDGWLGAYWFTAWPANALQKQRLLTQIVKRFEGALDRMCERASAAELEQVVALAGQLAQTWQHIAPDKSELLDGLPSALRRARQHQQEQTKANQAPVAAAPLSAALPGSGAAPDIDSSDERAWRQTLLKVTALLLEQQPDAAVGYRLRRHAIWCGITSAPLTAKGNKTQLAPVSPDRVSEYEAGLTQANLVLWQQIEQSLTLAPYWFDGHRLSAQAAVQLGYGSVAQAIAEELDAFLRRLPALKSLAFNDGTPFLSPACDAWLRAACGRKGAADVTASLAEEINACCQERGLDAALALLDEKTQQQTEPRERFYAALQLADLLDAAGMAALASGHYQQLWQEAQRLGLAQWEPGLVQRLERCARSG